jgi:hypothetical protein
MISPGSTARARDARDAAPPDGKHGPAYGGFREGVGETVLPTRDGGAL